MTTQPATDSLEDEPRIRPTLVLAAELLDIDRYFDTARRRTQPLLALTALSCGCSLFRATHGGSTYAAYAAVLFGLAMAGSLYGLARIDRRRRRARSDAYAACIADLKPTNPPDDGPVKVSDQ